MHAHRSWQFQCLYDVAWLMHARRAEMGRTKEWPTHRQTSMNCFEWLRSDKNIFIFHYFRMTLFCEDFLLISPLRRFYLMSPVYFKMLWNFIWFCFTCGLHWARMILLHKIKCILQLYIISWLRTVGQDAVLFFFNCYFSKFKPYISSGNYLLKIITSTV